MALTVLGFMKITVIAVLTLCLLVLSCENMDGERTIRGKIPPEENTVEAEKICHALAVPEQSTLLETRIISKEHLGVVTNKYSTDLRCFEVDEFLRTSNRLIAGRPNAGRETYAIAGSEPFRIEIDCNDIRDFRGIRKFYISCSWG